MASYQIGDFALQLGVTPDLLKHYEKYNIISSQKHNPAGYRFYDFTQAPLILESRKLQRFGFTLREIELFLNHGSINTVVEKLEKRAEELVLEISEKQMLLNHLHNLAQLTASIQTNRFHDHWSIEEWPAYYFFPHSNGMDFLKTTSAVRDSLADWMNAIPVVKAGCAQIYQINEKYNKLVYGLYAGEEDVKALDIYIGDPVKKAAAGWGLVYQQTHPEGLSTEQEFIKHILQKPLLIAEQHRFIPVGNICVQAILKTVSHGTGLYHRKIMIPLKCGD